MEIGESVSGIATLQKTKCVICSKTHKDPKKEKITKTAGKSGWKRATMTSKFEQISAKLAIYPGNSFPPKPAHYSHEGHHCLALSAFIKDESSASPTDVFLRMNFFLDKIGYSPNRNENSIGLPGREPGALPYDSFWKALDANKPLQMHIGNHDNTFFTQSAALLARLVALVSDSDLCKDLEQEEWEGLLMQLATHAENYAFIKLASNAAPWRLHATDHDIAIKVYFLPKTVTDTYKRNSGKITLTGLGHKKKPIVYPKPKLAVDPFD